MASTRLSTPPSVSVVVPLFNEEENVARLHAAIGRALEDADFGYELIFVDDGSQDSTAHVAAELARADPKLRLVRFRRNFGQTPAMAAGIELARGEVIVTMDGDLQNDPRDIPRLVAGIGRGADLVVGWRANRQDKLWTRRVPSVVANWLIAKVTGVPIKDNGCSLKAYRASVMKKVPLYSEMHRFIPAMASITGARVEEVEVRHHARRYGQSKYGLGRIWRVFFDLLAVKTVIAFAARPLLWFGILALVPIGISIVAGVFAAVVYLGDEASVTLVPVGIAIQFAALATFLFVCGILGELIFRTGDVRPHRLSGLTARLIPPAPADGGRAG